VFLLVPAHSGSPRLETKGRKMVVVVVVVWCFETVGWASGRASQCEARCC